MTDPIEAHRLAYLEAQEEYHELRERLERQIAAASGRADAAYRRWERLRDAARRAAPGGNVSNVVQGGEK